MDYELEIKKYFNKILCTVNIHYSFRFMKYNIVQKPRIDDLLCCLIGVIPNKYKQIIDTDISLEQQGLCSIEAYKTFLENFKNKFILSSSYYVILPEKLKKNIDLLLPLLLKDIKKLSAE